MELSITKQATSFAPIHELASNLQNSKVHYCIHKNPPLIQYKLAQSIPPKSMFTLSTHLWLGLPPSGFSINNIKIISSSLPSMLDALPSHPPPLLHSNYT
jgi:hypothetical protein